MENYSLHLLLLWISALWVWGWFLLPVSRRVFAHLPDGGLAAGRVLGLVLGCLVVFWGSSLHLLPASFGPFVLVGLPLAYYMWRGRKRDGALNPSGTRAWLRNHRRALLASDVVFLLAFAFFAWIRLHHPEINEFEKPMDSAIIGVLSRTDYLPAENPWFAGDKFTNYYYFGHFMGSQLKRCFGTPLPYAYNLIQPAFCAFFVSVLWSLCAALCASLWRGAFAMAFVALCGNFEPLRQWLFPVNGYQKMAFPHADWWSTTRVIPDTINEYPAFTLMLGDAHAHFFALSLAALLFCLCYELHNAFLPGAGPGSGRVKKLVALAGVVLGAVVMTNAWDTPLYCLLLIFILLPAPNGWKYALGAPTLAIGVTIPFIVRYKSQVGGIAPEWWVPDPVSFLLLWGGFLALWAVALFFLCRQIQNLRVRVKLATGVVLAVALITLSPFLPFFLPSGVFLLLAATVLSMASPGIRWRDYFALLMAALGLLALFLPFLCYQKGYFGGQMRHQDTVFKFGLQAWLLFGTATSCLVWKWVGSLKSEELRIWPGLSLKKLGAVYLLCLFWSVPFVCGWLLYTARTPVTRDYPGWAIGGGGAGGPIIATLSLDGARFLLGGDRRAVDWLMKHAAPGDYLIEPVGKEDGRWVQAYDQYGLMSAYTGIPAYIGWPQHARFWGANPLEVDKRLAAVWSLYDVYNTSYSPPAQLLPRHGYAYLPLETFFMTATPTMRKNLQLMEKRNYRKVYQEDEAMIFETR